MFSIFTYMLTGASFLNGGKTFCLHHVFIISWWVVLFRVRNHPDSRDPFFSCCTILPSDLSMKIGGQSVHLMQVHLKIQVHVKTQVPVQTQDVWLRGQCSILVMTSRSMPNTSNPQFCSVRVCNFVWFHSRISLTRRAFSITAFPLRHVTYAYSTHCVWNHRGILQLLEVLSFRWWA